MDDYEGLGSDYDDSDDTDVIVERCDFCRKRHEDCDCDSYPDAAY